MLSPSVNVINFNNNKVEDEQIDDSAASKFSQIDVRLVTDDACPKQQQ